MIPHEMMVQMYLTQQETVKVLTAQLEAMQKQNQKLQSSIDELNLQIRILTQQRFGRKTEKLDKNQISLFDSEDADVFNETELLTEEGILGESELETVTYTRKKPTGKRDLDLSLLEVVVEPTITLSDEELKERFPKGYKCLPDEVYRMVEHVPEKLVVHEYHIAVYAGKDDDGVIKGKRPEKLLKNSYLTPSLAAAVFDMKFVNHLPYNRICEDFKRKDAVISRQVMAGWMIRVTDRYLRPLYRALHQKILDSKLIHCDETPFTLIDNGRGPGTKDYMWVYHTCEKYDSKPVFVYEYQPGRSKDMPAKFLEGYKGYLVTDGYQVYHSLENERPDELKVAGCWTHLRRKFVEIVKAGKVSASGSTAEEAVSRIATIYHVDNMMKDKECDERLKHRQQSVQPLVDEFFTWIKEISEEPLDKGGKLSAAINYALNQEKYLRAFLESGMIPLDNNDAERSIKNFCVGKHSWHVIDSKAGAETSGMLYSIAETAKANGLKPYEYFKYVLEFMLEHQDDAPTSYINEIVPWSDKIPDSCRKTK